MLENPYLVEIENLKKYFPVQQSFFQKILTKKASFVHAVDDISFAVKKGETFCLVGESGCGKTTTGKIVAGLIEPTSGDIRFNGKSICKLINISPKEFRRRIGMVFQDVAASLNPRKTIFQTLAQPFLVHKLYKKEEIESKVQELMESVDLTPARELLGRHPHELSGGQKQRVSIARAISLNPDFVILDEPTSSLDVSIRAGILELLKNLQKRLGLTYLFITHDLAMVRSISNRVAVMYLGQIVELGNVKDLFGEPLHPYTKALLSSTPIPNPKITRRKKRIILHGEVPSQINPPSGCRFRQRCPQSHLCDGKKKTDLVKVEEDRWTSCPMYS